jgi:hypothetical protein
MVIAARVGCVIEGSPTISAVKCAYWADHMAYKHWKYLTWYESSVHVAMVVRQLDAEVDRLLDDHVRFGGGTRPVMIGNRATPIPDYL